MKNGDFPVRYVKLPEGNCHIMEYYWNVMGSCHDFGLFEKWWIPELQQLQLGIIDQSLQLE